ncbi:4844_t:CDS:2 [Acaulospora morrowiae]|uniref:4844_t:CDS:1 n=1 Tax=Acaulospora morrowiae TaxID=94023 RepID=A0A9N9G108_9GLOM|nr:4844_t:CDS:2 [Acaulospora morrowiae]
MASSSTNGNLSSNNVEGNHRHHSETCSYDTDQARGFVAKKCAKAILNEVEPEFDPEKSEVLDFACGIGLISQELCAHVKSILGVDISKDVVDVYNKKVWQQGIDKEEMQAVCLELKESEGDQLNGRRFDAVVCASSYHHIGDINSITKILSSYLKPGGELIVLDLKKDPETSHKFHGKHGSHDVGHTVTHSGGFDPIELENAFKNTGIIEDVSVNVAFEFTKWVEGEERDYVFEYLIAKGRRIAE